MRAPPVWLKPPEPESQEPELPQLPEPPRELEPLAPAPHSALLELPEYRVLQARLPRRRASGASHPSSPDEVAVRVSLLWPPVPHRRSGRILEGFPEIRD